MKVAAPARAPRSARRSTPPCISTSRRTSVRPIPRPPCERSIVCSTWVNTSKILGSISGAMPTPLSPTSTTTSPPSRRAESRIRPPSGVYLAALVRRLTSTCSSRDGSASTGSGPGPTSTSSACRRASICGRTDLDGPRDGRGQVERLRAELDLPLGDPRDVEQVVDQAGELLRLPADHLAGPGELLVGAGRLGDLHGAVDRGQGVAQLVGEHGEELVLAAVVLAELLVEPGVLDGDAGHLGDLDEDRLVPLGEGAVGLVEELDEAHVPPAPADQRRGEPAPRAPGASRSSRAGRLVRQTSAAGPSGTAGGAAPLGGRGVHGARPVALGGEAGDRPARRRSGPAPPRPAGGARRRRPAPRPAATRPRPAAGAAGSAAARARASAAGPPGPARSGPGR